MRETVEEGKDRMMPPSTLKKEGKMPLCAYLSIYPKTQHMGIPIGILQCLYIYL